MPLGISCLLHGIVLLCNMSIPMDQFLACSLGNGQRGTQPAATLGFQGSEGSGTDPLALAQQEQAAGAASRGRGGG